jgi:hypothetical protein
MARRWRAAKKIPPTSKDHFIIFVDGIFTTSLERLFTNVFEVSGAI